MINQYSSDFCELKAESFWYLPTDAASVEITAYGIIDVLVWNMNRKASWFSSAVSPHRSPFFTGSVLQGDLRLFENVPITFMFHAEQSHCFSEVCVLLTSAVSSYKSDLITKRLQHKNCGDSSMLLTKCCHACHPSHLSILWDFTVLIHFTLFFLNINSCPPKC